MGVCASALQAPITARKNKGRHELHTVAGTGKIFQLDADASGKAAEARLQRDTPVSPPISARPTPASHPPGQQQGTPPSSSGSRQQSGPPLRSAMRQPGLSSTRVRRLSFTGPCSPLAAAGEVSSGGPRTAPVASPTKPADQPSVGSAPPALPEAPLVPERRVRFGSPETARHASERGESESHSSLAAAVSALAPATQAAQPRPASGQPPSPARSSLAAAAPAPAAAASPAAAAAAAFAAAEARLRRGVTESSSPTRAAVAAAVPMTQLIHSVASLSRAGKEPAYRKQNQDNCFAFSQFCRPNQALLAALDGHGPNGHLVSEFLRANMPLLLAEQLGESSGSQAITSQCSSSSSSQGSGRGHRRASSGDAGTAAAERIDPTLALTATFLQADEALRCSSGVNVAYSGSTAVLCLLRGRRLTTAWVGDSKAVLARQDPRGCRAVCLTRDHKPGCPDERSRIQMCGGRVDRLSDQRGQPVGPQRVWLSDAWVPGLAMSRALGDAVAHTVGVSSEPETTSVELCPQDKWLLLATDGVWEFVDPQMAVDIISGCQDAEEACRTLVDCAWGKWLSEEEGVVDDITVVAVKLNPV